MKQKKPQKKPLFFCEKCRFETGNKKDFNRHTSTPKHIFETNETNILPKKPQTIQVLECNKCHLIFNSRTTLWRHRKSCDCIVSDDDFKDIDKEDDFHNDADSKIHLLSNIFQQQMSENKELRNLLIDQNNKLIEICKETTYIGNNNNINSNNKTFNLQLFLNETCKDAMNIMDFVDSLKLQISDLENVGKLGYVNGLSNIIVKNLNALDVRRRPVHCSDPKREILYIKDENKWEKENDTKFKLKKAIKYIAHKNTKLIPEWKAQNPECIYSDSKKSDEYNKIIIEAMGGEDLSVECSINENKIIKNVAKNVVIDKNEMMDKTK